MPHVEADADVVGEQADRADAEIDRRHGAADLEHFEHILRLGVNESAADHDVGPQPAAGHARRQRQDHAAGEIDHVAAGFTSGSIAARLRVRK